MTFKPKLTATLTAISLGLAAPAFAQDSDTAAPESLQEPRPDANQERDSMETTESGTEEVVEDVQEPRPDANQARDGMEEGAISTIAAGDVTDGQVDAFVKAALAVEEVRGEYLPQIQGAENQQEREALMDQANNEAMQAIDDIEGVTPSEYLAIARAAQADEALAGRINVELRAMRTR